MTLNAIAALAADTIFTGQVRAAAVNQAMTVLGESITASNELVENARQALAVATITDGCTALLPRFVWGMAATPGFSAIVNDTGDSNDAAINSAIVSQWSKFALTTNYMTAGV